MTFGYRSPKAFFNARNVSGARFSREQFASDFTLRTSDLVAATGPPGGSQELLAPRLGASEKPLAVCSRGQWPRNSGLMEAGYSGNVAALAGFQQSNRES